MHMPSTPGPRAAAQAFVEPIRRLEEVRAIKGLLADRPRDLLLFLLGINNALRAGDLLRVTVGQVRDLPPGQAAVVREKRSGRHTRLAVPAGAREALGAHLSILSPPAPPSDMYLFAGQPGWTPLTTERLDELVVEWTAAVGLEGTFGAHTLRKTFGYLQRTRFGVDLRLLANLYGHPSAPVTLRYLGLSGDEVGDVALTEL